MTLFPRRLLATFLLSAALFPAGCGGAQPLVIVRTPHPPVRIGVLPTIDRRMQKDSGPGKGGRLHYAATDAAADFDLDLAGTLEATPGLRVVRLPEGDRAKDALLSLGREQALDLILGTSLLEAGGTASPRNDFSTEYLARVMFRFDWIDGGTGETLVSADALTGEYGEIDDPPTLTAFEGGRPAALVTPPSIAWDREARLHRLSRLALDRVLRRFRRAHRLWEALGMLEQSGRWPRADIR